MFKVACVAALMGAALGFPQHEGPPVYGPQQPVYPAPHQPVYKDEPKKPYAFEYGVKDDYTGANYGHVENSDGNAVSGSYSVALPDGRVQTVKYIADHENGFHADVVYEGQAVYPEHKPTPYQPEQPAYGPPSPYA